MIDFLSTGTVLGLAAGLAPGPLLTLVISETLMHGVKAGLKVSIAPLITDLPLIAATLFIFAGLSHFNHLLGIISLTGGGYILFLGYENIRFQGLALADRQPAPRSLIKGILANILSPYPYLFWFSVGGPTMTSALQVDRWSALAFIGAFYAALVGAKVLLALAVNKSRGFLTGRLYIYSSRLIGVILVILALGLFRDGLALLGFSWQ
ncbi:LysE family transporter [uncultured Thiodictyon sp.]|uniref:LysE family translocator n=1 Tax=uncultured Thiodictyon sp. TaxID=1846217 RepID=UPI0026011088|nr:LysE family transporter [uncultured Thiodictyon sp.]